MQEELHQMFQMNSSNTTVLEDLAATISVVTRSLSSYLVVFGLIGNCISIPALKRQLQKGKIQDGFMHQIVIIALDLFTLFMVIILLIFTISDAFGRKATSMEWRRGISGWIFVSAAYAMLPIYSMVRTVVFNYLIGMSLDRLEAVMKPWEYYHFDQRRRAKKMFAVSCLLAFVLHLYEFFVNAVVFDTGEEAYKMEGQQITWHIGTAAFIQMAVKMMSIGALIFLGIYTHVKFQRTTFSVSTKAFAKTLNALFIGQVSLVVLCSVPWVVFKVQEILFPGAEKGVKMLTSVALSFSYVVEVALNFLLYFIISKPFRREAWIVIRCQPKEYNVVSNVLVLKKSTGGHTQSTA